MPFKASGRATDYRAIDRFDGGAGWIAHPEETMQRASHVLRASGGEADGGAWVVDPVNADGVDDLLAEFGDVRGVVVLMDRHARDAAAVADRHDVPVYVPSFVDPDVDAQTQPLGGTLPDSDYEVVRTVDWPGWDEAALSDGETLVVGDAVGTTEYFRAGGERVGVHPLLRVKPPRALRQFRPERILTGHGEGVLTDATRALQDALDGARRNAPEVWLNGLKALV
ncbi:hypothetical protein [Halobacterium yunchengense]|uniref:hypothetical protein n=1 Tax=Halobacterium yunchengense TaxID=3108497 RepID=UPI00300AC240